MGNNITEFFQATSSENAYLLNLPVFWAVTIDGVDVGSINSVLSDAGEKWQATTSPQQMTKTNNIIVAQAVVLPQETSEFVAQDSGNSTGGFLPGYAMTKRTNFLSRSFSVNFLETQVDIEHHFFRPWMIAMGVKGLIEYGPSLKANLEVKQYSNSGDFIKGFKFTKVFPLTVESYTLNYESTDILIKTVTFACDNYEQTPSPSTGYVGDINIIGGNLA